MDERAAVDHLKRGGVGGLEMLVDRYHTRATRAAYLVVRDRALAEYVAQGAFVWAFERIGGFDAGRPFGPWFMNLVLNEAITVARKRERVASREVRGAEEILARLADPAAGPQGLAEAGETRRRVWWALEELPPTQRAAIVQRYYLGMSEAEMSDVIYAHNDERNTVSCGPGNDTVYFDGKLDSLATDCEKQIL